MLTQMPTCLVFALLTMQPRLQAEESILAATRISVGGGKLKKEDSDRIARQWSLAAHPEGLPKAAPDKNVLLAAGFAIRRVKRQKKAP